MRSWYSHGWNNALSLRLILTIVPRLPRWLVPPIGALTTAICLAVMGRERRAAGRNLRRILGSGGWRTHRAVWSLFYNFSRFMVSYCELPRLTADDLGARVAQAPSSARRIREALDHGNGLIVLTAHLGNWEIGNRLLERSGAPVNVAMQLEWDNPAERWLSRARQAGSIRVLRTDATPQSILGLRAALARNEILAMQGDRVSGERNLTVRLFGAPFELPMGPFLLAAGCDAPLLPAFVLQEGWGRWRSEVGPPVRFPRTGDREADLTAGASEFALVLERVVREHPDQWFNFFDLWPAAKA